MNKKERHRLIKKIIAENWVESQSQLLDFLKSVGVEATQATISRDIKELHIAKVPKSSGRIRYAILNDAEDGESHLIELFKDSVKKIERAQFLNVITTVLGSANIVAAEMDDLQLPEIVGTLAGTDAVVLISKSEADAKKINEKLSAYLD